jgi:hypothetical protein
MKPILNIMLLQYVMLLLGEFNKKPVSRTGFIEALKQFRDILLTLPSWVFLASLLAIR